MGLIIRAGLWGLTAIGLWGAVKTQETATNTVEGIAEDAQKAGSIAVWIVSGLLVVWLAKWLRVV